MIVRPKFKDNWPIQPDNSDSALNTKIFNSHQCLSSINPDMLLSILDQLPVPHQHPPVQIDSQQLLKASAQQLKKSTYIMIKIFSQKRLSYRGFITWILIVDRKTSYLIDAIILRKQVQYLRKVFTDDLIVKLVVDLPEVNFALKREFGIQVVNGFDLGWMEAQFDKLSIIANEEKDIFQKQLQETPDLLIQRPPKPKTIKSLQRSLPLLFSYISFLPRTSVTLQPLFHLYSASILHKYQPPTYTPSHQPTHCLTKQQFENLTPKQQKLYFLLLQFREHVARMYDVNVELVIPKFVVSKILQDNADISVLEICGMYEEGGAASVGLELCKRIYDVVKLNQQQFQDCQKLEQLFNSSQSQYQPLKKTLQTLQWGDSTQWLNRKDDPSIRLYKQIISINEFDYSVGEEYINQMKGNVLKKSQISKYLKYAQFMRNKNYQKLENFYNMSLIVKEGSKEDQFSSGTDVEGVEKEEGCFKQLFLDKDNIPSFKSSSSLDEKISLQAPKPPESKSKSESQAQSLNDMPNIQQSSSNTNSRSRKSSDAMSFNINELDEICIKRSDIRPLPNTIQEIYELAQEVKKKADRKVKKKDKKGKGECKKQADFIPTWDDINQLLIAYANCLK